MAGESVTGESASEIKKFFCCKTKQSSNLVCVNCGNVFHKSCIERDFPKISYKKGDSRIQCCSPQPSDTKNVQSELVTDEDLLRNLVKEMQEKYSLLQSCNALLKENNDLLHKNNTLLEEKCKKLEEQVNKNRDQKTYAFTLQEKKLQKKDQVRKHNNDNSYTEVLAKKGTDGSEFIKLKNVQSKKMNELINIDDDVKTPEIEKQQDNFKENTNNFRENTNDFKEIVYKKRNQNKRIGTRKVTVEEHNTGFVGEERKVWLYLYRIRKHVTSDQIVDYIKKQSGFRDCQVMAKELPSDPTKLKSFVVTAPLTKKDDMYNPEFWPQNVGIRRFNYSLFQKYKSSKDFLG